MKQKISRKFEVEEKKQEATGEKPGHINCEDIRNKMVGRMFEFVDKSMMDHIREIITYEPYSEVPKLKNPWTIDDTSCGIADDIFAILTALKD